MAKCWTDIFRLVFVVSVTKAWQLEISQPINAVDPECFYSSVHAQTVFSSIFFATPLFKVHISSSLSPFWLTLQQKPSKSWKPVDSDQENSHLWVQVLWQWEIAFPPHSETNIDSKPNDAYGAYLLTDSTKKKQILSIQMLAFSWWLCHLAVMQFFQSWNLILVRLNLQIWRNKILLCTSASRDWNLSSRSKGWS